MNGLISRYGGEILKEAIERVTFLDVVEQSLDGNACAGETGHTMHDRGINRNHAGKAGLFLSGHNLKISQASQSCK